MITIYRMRGLRIIIYANDHDPAHVHVFRNKDEARINLAGPELVYVDGLKRQDVRLALEIVRENAAAFMQKWLEIHGQAFR